MDIITPRMVLNEVGVLQKIHRMTLEIQEQLYANNKDVYIIGIEKTGYILAKTIFQLLEKLIPNKLFLKSLKIDKNSLEILDFDSSVNLNNVNILFVDDVINSGKTLLYCLKAILNNRPYQIKVLVLVERMYKNFPIKPDFIGISLATTAENEIQVCLNDRAGFEIYLI